MSTSMQAAAEQHISTTTHLTITRAVTGDGDRFEVVNGELAEAIVHGPKFDPGQQGTVLVSLGVSGDTEDQPQHDEVFLDLSRGGATPVHVIVRVIELLEQMRDDLRAAGQS